MEAEGVLIWGYTDPVCTTHVCAHGIAQAVSMVAEKEHFLSKFWLSLEKSPGLGLLTLYPDLWPPVALRS